MPSEPSPPPPDPQGAPSEAPRSYSTAEVARRMGVSVPTVQRWVDRGTVKSWKTPGGHRRIDAEAAESLFAEAERQADAAAVPRIVLIEDDPIAGELLSEMVRSVLPQARLTWYDHAIPALVSLGTERADALLTDLDLPRMNGVEMLAQLARTEGAWPPVVVAVTNLRTAQIEALGGLPPGVALLHKPILLESLERLLAPLRRDEAGTKN